MSDSQESEACDRKLSLRLRMGVRMEDNRLPMGCGRLLVRGAMACGAGGASGMAGIVGTALRGIFLGAIDRTAGFADSASPLSKARNSFSSATVLGPAVDAFGVVKTSAKLPDQRWRSAGVVDIARRFW